MCGHSGTAFMVWRFKVTQMQPRIGSEFQSCFHWQCLMMSSFIHFHKILVQDTRPDQYSPFLGHYLQRKFAKLCPTTLFNVREIEKHSKNAWTLRSIDCEETIRQVMCQNEAHHIQIHVAHNQILLQSTSYLQGH
jgi:hypothetical protein